MSEHADPCPSCDREPADPVVGCRQIEPSPEADLESAAYVLYVAQREIDSIPACHPLEAEAAS